MMSKLKQMQNTKNSCIELFRLFPNEILGFEEIKKNILQNDYSVSCVSESG